jgi:putative membrane protein
MKHLIRVFLFNVFALWLTSQLIPGFVIPGGWQTTLFAGLILSLLMLIVTPLLKILFIPINILTFGLLSWFINVIIIYLLTVFVPEIHVSAWIFRGASFLGFIIPVIHISYFVNLVITSLIIASMTDILHYVSEE